MILSKHFDNLGRCSERVVWPAGWTVCHGLSHSRDQPAIAKPLRPEISHFQLSMWVVHRYLQLNSENPLAIQHG